jgi:D-amino-acid oxidase
MVIGAGVSGLTTGICLAEAGAPVWIVAAEPPLSTTSVVAGAMWGPSFQEPMARTMAWTEQSLRDFTELAADPDSGVRLASALTVGAVPAGGELPPQARIIPQLREVPADELPAGFASGSRARMPLIDMPRYLDHLRKRFEAAGGTVEIRPVGSLEDALGEAPVVVNCAGLGARELAGDESVRPVFGQHVMVSNPGLEELVLELSMSDEWVSWFPHRDRVVCGGIRVPGRWDRTPDPAITERILQRCRVAEPRLRDTEVLEVTTGLRPDRPSVRVEAERRGAGLVVHNYGHGGNGVSLSWGCAREAAALALS